MMYVVLKDENNELFPFSINIFYSEDSQYLINLIRFYAQMGYKYD